MTEDEWMSLGLDIDMFWNRGLFTNHRVEGPYVVANMKGHRVDLGYFTSREKAEMVALTLRLTQ